MFLEFNMSRKQEIYIELMRASIPRARNLLSRFIVYGKSKEEAYNLCELTHNLYGSILNEEFTDHDIWFLNVQAKNYHESAKGTVYFESINILISELFNEVPDGKKVDLKWSGPET